MAGTTTTTGTSRADTDNAPSIRSGVLSPKRVPAMSTTSFSATGMPSAARYHRALTRQTNSRPSRAWTSRRPPLAQQTATAATAGIATRTKGVTSAAERHREDHGLQPEDGGGKDRQLA